MEGPQITTKIPGQTKTQKKDCRMLGERATGRAEVKKTGELMKDWQEHKGQTDRVGYFSLFIFFRALERLTTKCVTDKQNNAPKTVRQCHHIHSKLNNNDNNKKKKKKKKTGAC